MREMKHKSKLRPARSKAQTGLGEGKMTAAISKIDSRSQNKSRLKRIAGVMPVLLATALASVSLQAQKPGKDSWDNLNHLRAGQKIQVVQMDMKSLKGNFLGLTDEMISLRVKRDEVVVPREDVFRVSFRGKPKRLQNSLIFAGVGALVGAISGAAVGAGFHEAGETGVFMLVFTPIGAGVGAAVGAAAPLGNHETVYRAKIKRGDTRP